MASTIYPVVNTTLDDTETYGAVAANTDFHISLTTLRAGTKYNYKVKVKNNINVDYSEWSTDTISSTLQLPGNNSINTSVVFTASANNDVTTPSLNDVNVISHTEKHKGPFKNNCVFEKLTDIEAV